MKKPYTIWDLNRLAKKFSLRLYAGKGYYYWEILNPRLDTPPSVYVYRFSDLKQEQWEYELSHAVKKSITNEVIGK